MYSKGHYARRKFFSSIRNLIWSTLMFVGLMVVLGICIYGCNIYFNVMGPTIK